MSAKPNLGAAERSERPIPWSHFLVGGPAFEDLCISTHTGVRAGTVMIMIVLLIYVIVSVFVIVIRIDA